MHMNQGTDSIRPAADDARPAARGAAGMRLDAIRDLLQCSVLVGDDRLNMEVEAAVASDGMSVVLASRRPRALLVTGLTNIQSVRTAHVADISAILYVRGVGPQGPAINLAREKNIVVLVTPLGMFDACGILRSHGLKGET